MNRNFGIQTRVGNTEVTGGQQIVTQNTLCHQMPSYPRTAEFNYLHTCDNGPILGQYVIIRGIEPDYEFLQVAEVYVWNAPQPEDRSDLHGKNGQTTSRAFVTSIGTMRGQGIARIIVVMLVFVFVLIVHTVLFLCFFVVHSHFLEDY